MGKPTQAELDARLRLETLMRERGSSFAGLSRLLGRNPAYLQQYVRRGSPRHLDEPDIRTLAQFLGVEAETLNSREGEAARAAPSSGWVRIPRLDIGASAGPGSVGAQEISFDSFQFSPRWLRENGLDRADLSAIRVEGDSMEPLLRDRDEILVDRTRRTGEGVFVVRIGEALHVKQVQASAPDRILLVSANPAYAPLELPRAEAEVVGRVVWKGGRV